MSEDRDEGYEKAKAKSGHGGKVGKVLKSAGYARGGDAEQDKKMIKKAIDEHDAQLHGGKKTHLKLKHGGMIEGKKTEKRADKYARGGSVARGKHTTTHVNVNLAASEADKKEAFQKGAMTGATMAAQKMGGPRPGAGAPMQARAPMPPPAPGGVPAGGGVPPTMQKRGGRTYAQGGKVPKMEFGAGGGKGRLEKIKKYGKKPNA